MRSFHKPDFYPIPKLTPVLQSYDIPAPVIFCSRSDPNPLSNPDQSLLPCNGLPVAAIHRLRSDPIQGLEPVSGMDIDPWIPARSKIEVRERITDLTATEHGGKTWCKPITTVSTTSSDPSATSKTGSPEFVKDVIETKRESENPRSLSCDICDVICNSRKQFNRHLKGNRHLTNHQKRGVTFSVKQETTLPAANKSLDQDSDDKNKVSLQNGVLVDSMMYCADKDSRNVVTEQVMKPMSNGGTHNSEEQLSIHQPLSCDICKVSCSSKTSFQQHISGKNHLKNIKLSEKIVCELCGISCTSHDDLSNHISGKKHQTNLQNSGNLNGNSQLPMIKDGEIVEEIKKRKANVSFSNDNDDSNDKKKQKTVEKDMGSSVLLTCKKCDVVCKGIMAFNSHLASFEHSAIGMNGNINRRGFKELVVYSRGTKMQSD